MICLLTDRKRCHDTWYSVLIYKKSIKPFQLYLLGKASTSFPRQENSWNGYETQFSQIP
jgi:hypothetical protein